MISFLKIIDVWCLVLLQKFKLLPRVSSFISSKHIIFAIIIIPNNYNTTKFFQDIMPYSDWPPDVFKSLVRTAT